MNINSPSVQMELIHDELSSLKTSREEFSQVKFVYDSFLALGVNVEEYYHWNLDTNLDLNAVHWVSDRHEHPKNKVMEGYVAENGACHSQSSSTYGSLYTQVSDMLVELTRIQLNLLFYL